MAPQNRFLDGRWVPADSHITYQDFKHWEYAMRQSHQMAQAQAEGQQLRQHPMETPSSPIFTHQICLDKQQPDNLQEPNPEAVIFRLARHRPALDALRRTHKMRYRRNLSVLAESFPLADELVTKEKKVKKDSEKAQGLTGAEILAQKELAKRKNAEMTVEELKYIREMKAAKVKAAAQERLKEKNEKAARNDITRNKVENSTGKSVKEIAGKKVDPAARKTAEKTVTKSMEKTTGKSVEKVARKGTEKNAPKVTEKTAPKSAEKPAPKSTGKTVGKRSGKMSLRTKMMPKMKRW